MQHVGIPSADLTSKFMTSLMSKEAISTPPTEGKWMRFSRAQRIRMRPQSTSWSKYEENQCYCKIACRKGSCLREAEQARIAELVFFRDREEFLGIIKHKSLPLPTKPRARQWKASLRDVKSFLMELMTSLRNSSFCKVRNLSLLHFTWRLQRYNSADTLHCCPQFITFTGSQQSL